ncbi:unnamed protein product, partial [Rotaria sp. Silwood1]
TQQLLPLPQQTQRPLWQQPPPLPPHPPPSSTQQQQQQHRPLLLFSCHIFVSIVLLESNV